MSIIQEVTRENFERILPTVFTFIDNADFVSVDTELTGLHAGKTCRYSHFDDLPTRYKKLRESSQQFAVVQLGISCFKRNPKNSRWSSHSYSFSVAPMGLTNDSNAGSELKFTCQASAISFLAMNGFDFNKSFCKGIGYISRSEETRLREGLGGGERKDKYPTIEIVKEQDVKFIAGIYELVEEWLPNEQVASIELPQSNSYQRLLIHQQCQIKYPGTFLEKNHVKGKVALSIHRGSREEPSRQQVFLDQLEGQIGLRKVWDRVINGKKTVVVHNGFLDLCHLMHKFEGPLAAEFNDFKSKVCALLPNVFDTKYLCLMAEEIRELSGNSLGELVEFLKDAGECVNSPTEGIQLHDAGYDAFCTGKVFVAFILKYHSPVSQDNILQSVDGLANRLNIMQSPYAYANLAGSDPEPDWSKILVLSKIPVEWQNRDVHGFIAKNDWKCSYSRNNEESYFLSFETTEDSARALAFNFVDLGYSLMPIDQFRAGAVTEQVPLKRSRSNE